MQKYNSRLIWSPINFMPYLLPGGLPYFAQTAHILHRIPVSTGCWQTITTSEVTTVQISSESVLILSELIIPGILLQQPTNIISSKCILNAPLHRCSLTWPDRFFSRPHMEKMSGHADVGRGPRKMAVKSHTILIEILIVRISLA